MAWTVTVPPVDEPVSLPRARRHLRVDQTFEDEDIADWVKTARENIEEVCEHAIMPQQWTEYLPSFPPVIELRGHTVRSVVSVSYEDAQGQRQEIPADRYRLRVRKFTATLAAARGFTWPAGTDVEVLYELGYPNADAVPGPLRSAILLLIADYFVNRGASVIGVSRVDNPAVKRLLVPYTEIRP